MCIICYWKIDGLGWPSYGRKAVGWDSVTIVNVPSKYLLQEAIVSPNLVS